MRPPSGTEIQELSPMSLARASHKPPSRLPTYIQRKFDSRARVTTVTAGAGRGIEIKVEQNMGGHIIKPDGLVVAEPTHQRAALAADGMVTAGPVLGARGGEMQS